MENSKVFVPPLKTQGIKTKLVPFIKENALLNQNTIWIEPFLGSGVVGFNLAPQKAVFADSNPHIIEFYNRIKAKEITAYTVRQFLEDEGEKLSFQGDEYYYEVRKRFNAHHSSLDFLFLNRSCFNGMIRFNKNLEFNVPFGHKPQRFSKAYITKIVNQVAQIEKLLETYNWSFKCQSFEATISEAPSNSFVYCDPPYIGRHVDYYDSWDETQEFTLQHTLGETSAHFMLSTWDHNDFRSNEYIKRIWGDCYKTTKEHFYHLGAREKNRNPITEALLTNYTPKISTPPASEECPPQTILLPR